MIISRYIQEAGRASFTRVCLDVNTLPDSVFSVKSYNFSASPLAFSSSSRTSKTTQMYMLVTKHLNNACNAFLYRIIKKASMNRAYNAVH